LEEDQGHSVAHWNSDQFSDGFTFAELRRFADDLRELVNNLALLVHEQFRIANHVNEQNVSNFEMGTGFELGGHVCADYLGFYTIGFCLASVEMRLCHKESARICQQNCQQMAVKEFEGAARLRFKKG